MPNSGTHRSPRSNQAASPGTSKQLTRSAPRKSLLPLVIDTTANLIQKRQLVSADEFQAMMGWSTRQAVWKALASRRVFSMSFGTERYFPAFFADAAYPRTHLQAVSKMLGDLPGGAKIQFFISRKGSLSGKTTLEALAAGRVEEVLRLAAAVAESDAS